MEEHEKVAWLSLRYRDGVSPKDHLQVALYEQELWTAFGLTAPRPLPRRHTWLSDTMGASSGASEIRQALLRKGGKDSPVWRALAEEQLSISAAHRAHLLAVRQRGSYLTNLERAIDQFTENAYVDARGPRVPMPVTGKKTAAPNEAGKRLKADLRERLTAYVHERAGGKLESWEVEELVTTTTLELDVVLTSLFARVHHRRQAAPSAVSRGELVRACEQLGMPAPPATGQVDMADAKKRFKRLSVRLHPDRNPDGSTEETFDAVQRAWSVLVQHQESNG